MIQVLLVAPSPALRAGLRSLLSSDNDIKIVDEQNEWSDSLQDDQYEADVVKTTSASYEVMQKNDEDAFKKAILFLGDEPSGIQLNSQSSQVWGILPMDATGPELTAAVHALYQGLIVGTPSLLFPPHDESSPLRGPLTDREAEILSLLATGLANKQIAIELGISEHTVKFHVSSIYAKLNATNRTQAVREGLRNGWIVL